MELDRLAGPRVVIHGNPSLLGVNPDDVSDEKVTTPECALGGIDGPPEVKAVFKERPFLIGKRDDFLVEALDSRLSSQFKNGVLVGTGDDGRFPEGLASLGDHRPDADGTGEKDADGTAGKDLAVQEETVFFGIEGTACHASNDLQIRAILIQSVDEFCRRKGVRITKEEKCGGLLWNFGQSVKGKPLQGLFGLEMHGLDLDSWQECRKEANSRSLFHLPGDADDSLAGTSDQTGGFGVGPDPIHHLPQLSSVVGRGKDDDQIGPVSFQQGDDLSQDLFSCLGGFFLGGKGGGKGKLHDGVINPSVSQAREIGGSFLLPGQGCGLIGSQERPAWMVGWKSRTIIKMLRDIRSALIYCALLLYVLGGTTGVYLKGPRGTALNENDENPFRPGKVIALSLAAEEIIVGLDGPGRLGAVTNLARNRRFSNIAEEAASIPHVVSGTSIERIVRLEPNLVLITPYTDAAARGALERYGIRILQLGDFDSIPRIQEGILEIGRALDLEERAGALIQEMEQKIVRAGARIPREGKRPRLLFYDPADAWVAGSGTVIDDVIRLAGAINVAAENGIGGTQVVRKETVARWNPEILLVGGEEDGKQEIAARLRAEPVLGPVAAVRQASGRGLIVLPIRTLTAISQHAADAIDRLSAALHAQAPADSPGSSPGEEDR